MNDPRDILEQQLLQKIEEVYANSGLGKWFGKGGGGSSSGGGWDRYNTSGKKIGKCGDAAKGSSYSACLGKKYVARLRSKNGKKAIGNWVKRKKAAQNKHGRGKKGSSSKGNSPIAVKYTNEEIMDKLSNNKNLQEMNYTGAVGIHEFMAFYNKATAEEEKQMQHCMQNNNVECVKSLITRVTGMEMDKIKETNDGDKKIMRTPELPVGYAKALKKLESLKETSDAYGEYVKIANKVIEKLKRIQTVGKSKSDIKDIVTKSTVDSILIGLGNRYPEITKQLENLSKSAFTWQDLVRIHGKKRIDMNNWTDTSINEKLHEGSSSNGTNSGTDDESSNLGKYKSDDAKFGANHMIHKMSRSQLKEMLRRKIVSKKQENLSEGYYEDKEKERMNRSFRFGNTSTPEKKYWITPDGEFEDTKGSPHEDWIKANDTSIKVGPTLIDTYENAIKKGYIRVIYDTSGGFITLSNLPNYDFSMSGNSNMGIPDVNQKKIDAIKSFVEEKDIQLVGTGKGKLINGFVDDVNESALKNWVAAGALGLNTLMGLSASDDAPTAKITQTTSKAGESSLLNKKTSDYIAHWEGSKDVVYKDSEGKPTIGIGHYLNNSQEDKNLFKTLFGDTIDYDKILNGQQKLSSNQIEKLFNVDVKIKEKLAAKKIGNFSNLPTSVKNAIINALYRGDLGPKTIAFMNSGNWNSAAKEYLNHKNAKSGPEQIKRRMNTNALAFAQFAKDKG